MSWMALENPEPKIREVIAAFRNNPKILSSSVWNVQVKKTSNGQQRTMLSSQAIQLLIHTNYEAVNSNKSVSDGPQKR
jgi:hypothetical protein